MRSGIHAAKTASSWGDATYSVTLAGDWLERFEHVAASLGTAGSNYLRELLIADLSRRAETKPVCHQRRGSGSVYLRGNIWWMKYYVGGSAVRASTGRRTRREAERVLDETLDHDRAVAALRKEPSWRTDEQLPHL